jgi:hypothetical protein
LGVFISHFLPDRLFGLAVLQYTFPKTKTGDELVEMLEAHFPNMKAVDFGLHWQATFAVS